MTKPLAILTADLHLRSDVPICRTDDYIEEQFKKLDKICQLAYENKIPILFGGDFGHKPYWGVGKNDWLFTRTVETISPYDIEIIGIPGQHDLPNHNIGLWEKSGLAMLNVTGFIELITDAGNRNGNYIYPNSDNPKFCIHCFPYGQEIDHPIKSWPENIPNITITHQMVLCKDKLWPDQEAPKGISLLKKYPEYDLILSGDNHQSFVIAHEGRLLVNPGSMMRMSANQKDHTPRVYIWYDNNSVEEEYFPIKKNVVSRTHIDKIEARDERIQAYVDRLDSDYDFAPSFKRNIETCLIKNRVKKTTRDIVWESIES